MSDETVRIVVAIFQTEEGADSILYDLEAADSAGYVGIQNAAVLRRDANNKLHIREKKDWGGGKGAAAGMALSTTLAIALGGRAFINLETKAGLTSDEIQKAVDVLRSALSDSMSTYPGVSKSVLDQLFEGARTAFSMGIAQTMLILAAILLVSGVVIWFGMRKASH